MRRHVNRLVELRYVERRGEGLVVPSAVTVRPDFIKFMDNLNASLLLMTRRMEPIAGELCKTAN